MGNHRIFRIIAFDNKESVIPVRTFGKYGSAHGELDRPKGERAAAPPRPRTARPAGRHTHSRAPAAPRLPHAAGVAVHGDAVFVADCGNDRISVFTREGGFLRTIGSQGQAPGQFRCPHGVAILRGRYLLVTEPSRLQVLSLEGVPLQAAAAPPPHSSSAPAPPPQPPSRPPLPPLTTTHPTHPPTPPPNRPVAGAQASGCRRPHRHLRRQQLQTRVCESITEHTPDTCPPVLSPDTRDARACHALDTPRT